MNIHDLQAFVAFAETGSIVRAAERIHLTQSATTRRLQRVEAALGAGPLLDRSVKPPTLTANGRRVLPRCQAVLAGLRELANTGADAGTPAGELRMGVAYGLGDRVLGPPLDALRQRFPALALSVSSHWTSALMQDVRSGRLDCAVGVLVDDAVAPPGLQAHPLREEPLIVVASRELPLPRSPRGGFTLAELGGLGWILAPQGCAYRARLEQACHRAGTELRVAVDVLERDLRVSLVARGLGLGLMMPRVLRDARLGRRLRRVPVADFAPRAVLSMFVGRGIGTLAPAVDHLIASLAVPQR